MAPALLAVGGFIASIAGPVAVRVLLALGVGVATFTGLDVAVTYLKDTIVTGASGLAPVLVQFAGILRFDVAVNLIFGAITARLTLQGLSGVINKFVLK